eukprot:SAG22_NODE_18630_length_284_cov_0.281081_1_plen_32_part_10
MQSLTAGQFGAEKVRFTSQISGEAGESQSYTG